MDGTRLAALYQEVVNGNTTRGGDGRFAPKFNRDLLIEIVRAVCEVAAKALGLAPKSVSQAAFDAHRSDAGFPVVPRAYRISGQLGMPWPDLLASIFGEGRSAEQTVAMNNRSNQNKPSNEQISYALRVVATRLDATTLRRGDYEAERAKVEAEGSRRWLHGHGQLLPTLGQIEKTVLWADALKLADLAEPPADTSVAGMSHAEVALRFVEELGVLPASTSELRDYAGLKQLSIKDTNGKGNRQIEPTIKELRVLWREAGHAERLPPRRNPWKERDRSVLEGLTPEKVPPARKRKAGWTLEDCIEGLVVALDATGSEPLTQVRLRGLAKHHPDIPSPSIVDRIARKHGLKGGDLTKKAVKRRLQAR